MLRLLKLPLRGIHIDILFSIPLPHIVYLLYFTKHHCVIGELQNHLFGVYTIYVYQHYVLHQGYFDVHVRGCASCFLNILSLNTVPYQLR